MLHGSRITTPVMYSPRLTARPYKEKKCVFPETCFGIYYKIHPELKYLCCAWILSQIKPYCSEEESAEWAKDVWILISCPSSHWSSCHQLLCPQKHMQLLLSAFEDAHLIAEFVQAFMLHAWSTLWPFSRLQVGTKVPRKVNFLTAGGLNHWPQPHPSAGTWQGSGMCMKLLPWVSLGVPNESDLTHGAAGELLWWAETQGASRAPPACGSAGGAAKFRCAAFRVSRGLSLAGSFFVTYAPCPHPMPTLAMGTPSALNSGRGGFGPSLLALCQGWVSLRNGDSPSNFKCFALLRHKVS